jgi:hypothetical protein
MDAMGEFGHTNCAERRLAFANPFTHEFEKPRHIEALPLGLDHDTRIKDYSEAGGFHG